MISDSIKSLIIDEQSRQAGLFVEHVDLDEYLDKLEARAEILADSAEGRCRGVVAFYCNDHATRQAYITLVLVDPRDRGMGIGRSLVGDVLELAKQRGFASCRLEVTKRNEAARAMYDSLGFRLVEDRQDRQLMEIGL